MKLRMTDVWTVLRSAIVGFFEDGALSHAAAMAFYAATSLAPILLIVLAVAGMFTGREAAEIAISAQLVGLIGPQGADILKATIASASQHSGALASAIAIATLLFGASGVFGEMQSTLNLIWKTAPAARSLRSLARARIASLGLVAALGFLLLVSLAASAGISAVGDVITSRLPFGEFVLVLVNTIVSLILVAILFAAIFKVLPDRSLSWRDVRFGSVITAALFTIGKSLIGWYLGTSAVASSYGAAASPIVLLLWIFYSSAIFLLGAEITRAFAVRFGTRRDLKHLEGAGHPEDEAPQSATLPTPARRPPTLTAGILAIVAVMAALAIPGREDEPD